MIQTSIFYLYFGVLKIMNSRKYSKNTWNKILLYFSFPLESMPITLGPQKYSHLLRQNNLFLILKNLYYYFIVTKKQRCELWGACIRFLMYPISVPNLLFCGICPVLGTDCCSNKLSLDDLFLWRAINLKMWKG